MPRDGSGIYSRPPGTDGVPDTSIESTKYNGNVADVETDLNTPRPIIAGGTGSNTAIGARDNLDAERAMATVTNYNTQVWESGSFWSDTSATGEPVDGHLFSGTCHVINNDQNNIVLQARDWSDTTVPGRVYVREKKSGVWGAWTIEAAAALDAKVDVAGDVMTGDLIISKVNPALLLNKVASGQNSMVLGRTNNVGRWRIDLGNAETEAGSNSGSNFEIVNYDDAGNPLVPLFKIVRSSGVLQLAASPLIQRQGAFVVLNNTAVASGAGIQAQISSAKRWHMMMCNGVTETGSGNTGSNFALERYSDGGAFLANAFTIGRADGAIQVPGNLNVTSGIVSQTAGASLGAANAAVTVAFSGGGAQYGMTMRPAADTTNAQQYYNAAGGPIGSISITATGTAFNTTSDERLKEDLKSFDAGNIVDNTNVYDFKWRTTGERAYGILAQQANEVYPTAVTYSKEEDWWGVDYSRYVPVLLQELKALRARVAELEGKVGVGVQPA